MTRASRQDAQGAHFKEALGILGSVRAPWPSLTLQEKAFPL